MRSQGAILSLLALLINLSVTLPVVNLEEIQEIAKSTSASSKLNDGLDEEKVEHHFNPSSSLKLKPENSDERYNRLFQTPIDQNLNPSSSNSIKSNAHSFEFESESPSSRSSSSRDPKHPSFEPQPPPPPQTLAEIQDSELSIEQQRLKYGQSWGPGGRASHWVWKHWLKPILMPFKQIWKFFFNPIIKSDHRPNQITELEHAFLAAHPQLTPQLMRKLQDEFKLGDQKPRINHLAWMNPWRSKQTTQAGPLPNLSPQTDLPLKDPLNHRGQAPELSDLKNQDDIPIAQPSKEWLSQHPAASIPSSPDIPIAQPSEEWLRQHPNAFRSPSHEIPIAQPSEEWLKQHASASTSSSHEIPIAQPSEEWSKQHASASTSSSH